MAEQASSLSSVPIDCQDTDDDQKSHSSRMPFFASSRTGQKCRPTPVCRSSDTHQGANATEARRTFGIIRPDWQTDRATNRQRAAALQDAGPHSYRPLSYGCLLFVFAAIALNASEPPPAPEINRVEPFVWRLDATNSITITGKNLSGFQGLWTSRHGIIPANRLNAIPGDSGKELNITTAFDAMTAPGPFAVRVVTDAGISGPSMAMLEALPELKPAKDGLVEGNGCFDGHIKENAGETFRVELKQGDDFAMDVSAGRFGSKLDPVLRITDGKGAEVAYVQDSPGVGVDCVARFKVPSSGKYQIQIRDASFGSGRDYRYHVRFGSSAGGGAAPLAEGTNDVNIMSTSGGAPAKQSDFAKQFVNRVLVDKPLGVAVLSGRVLGLGEPLRSVYWLRPVATYPVGTILFWPKRLPLHPNLHGPVSMNGIFQQADDRIGFDIKMKNAAKWRFVAMSRRLGGECDPMLRIADKDGKTLIHSHLFNNESVLTWDCKEPGNYLFEIWDAAGQFGPDAAFHIQAQENPAEFELNSETDSLRIPVGGEAELPVTIDRDGYNGLVRFEIADAPDGISLDENIAKEKSKEATFKLKLADTLKPGSTFPIKIRGRRGEKADAPPTPLYTSAYWKKQFPNLYSPMFEFEDTVWVTVLPEKKALQNKN